MNEEDIAREFNRALDHLLSGEKRDRFDLDPDAMQFANKLARIDFSGESAIRKSLRKRLIKENNGIGISQAIFSLFRRSQWVQSALVAAGFLLLLLPVTRFVLAPRGTVRRTPELARPLVVAGGTRPGAPVRNAPVLSDVSSTQVKTAGYGIAVFFSSRPMPRLEGERLQNFPIETTAGPDPVVVAEGRGFKSESGSGMTWETESLVITLKSRVISPDELFERRVL